MVSLTKLLVERAIKLPTVKFFDTSALLGGYKLSIEDDNYISNIVFQELEHIKFSSTKDEIIKYKARSLVRYLMKHREMWRETGIQRRRIEKLLSKSPNLEDKNDSLLICEARLLAAQHKDIEFVTADASEYLLASSYKEIHAVYYKETAPKEDLWKGYQEIYFDDDLEMAQLYEHPEVNSLHLEVNEYAFLYYDAEIADIVRWDGEQYVSLKYKEQNTDWFGKINPRNIQQKLFFDLLQNRDIPVKLARGQYGSGKTFLALVHAFNLIKWHKFDKIVFVRNNVEVYGSQKLGALPGEQEDKLLPFLGPFIDHAGEHSVRTMLDKGTLVVEPLQSLRGRNFDNTLIMCSEAENLTKEHIQLIIARAAEGSEVWFDADNRQRDKVSFEKSKGIETLIERLTGQKLFGYVHLVKSERSETAAMADLLN